MSSSLRKKAVSAIASVPVRLSGSKACKNANVAEIFGEDVFSLKVMKDYLPKNVFKKLLCTVKKGETIDADIADEVAVAMKRWAINKGATHYTHWFQPLTGTTAEKHDSFIESDFDSGITMEFSGKNLIQGEPDASSFPSGGIRSTFEARGYTAWDATSPAFIKRDENASTLCIPTAFCSYTGEALDKKTPLLRSMQAVSRQAARLLACFGEKVEGRLHVTLGAEQEYFLVDKELYITRPDLIQCGRTLFGCTPPKHQQLEDHYFGSIKPRILSFMSEVDQELWKLGIPSKTRHNEVAPAQFEIAAQFEELNLAVDHNMMIMEVLRQVADRNGLVCLMHEKPFAGVNGSGKHNNWSFGANGRNLLEPGTNPHQNAIFLTVLAAIIKAVDTHADLLRIAVSGAGNDHRLGANEAPPAIISIFLGEQLYDIIEQIEAGGAQSSKPNGTMQVGVDTIPILPKDATDRNRTSPFAFTGNKFEFRAVGSSQNCAGPNTVLNTIVAEAMDEISTELEKLSPEKFNEGLQKVLQSIIKKHKRILFNGDNYSENWAREAESRGLLNMRSTPEALKAFVSDKNIKLFEKYAVLSTRELEARHEIFVEMYETLIQIEAETALNIVKTAIFPAVIGYQSKIVQNISSLNSIGVKTGVEAQKTMAEKIGAGIEAAATATSKLEEAIGCAESSVSAMLELREAVDSLELLVEDSVWPLAKYSELLFIY